MRTKPGWKQHEADIQERLGLDATICSGNKFYDSGDAVDNQGNSVWPLWVEAKYRERKSYSVVHREVDSLRERAEMLGKRFALAVRFYTENTGQASDYVLLPLDDYEEMLSIVRAADLDYRTP